MDEPRYLLITADDFGIGPETSRGILDLAAKGVLTSTVLLVNSPYAAECVGMWRRAGGPIELGWHPCLTLDSPILAPHKIPSLVDERGHFLKLGTLLKRLLMGRIQQQEVEAEFQAQFERFIELVGFLPANVNAHHHVHIFRPIGDALAAVLTDVTPRPYVRRVVESVGKLARIPGARIKRVVLTQFGRRSARRQQAFKMPGNDWLLGITDPPFVHDPAFFHRWLQNAPGQFVELTCHPGYLDATIEGRDGSFTDGQLHRRQRELELLGNANIQNFTSRFTLVSAGELAALRDDRVLSVTRKVG